LHFTLLIKFELMQKEEELLKEKISEFDKYKPFPEEVCLLPEIKVVNIERFLEVNCKESLQGSERAIKLLDLFKQKIEK
jgi:hypothetical protein